MVKSFSIEELIAFAESDSVVKRVLRLDQMALPKTNAAQLMKILKRGNVRVDGRVAAAIGRIIIFLGMNHKSSMEMLCRAVSHLEPYLTLSGRFANTFPGL